VTVKMAGSKLPFGIGEYPAEFNAKVHGPYDPARFYGKREYLVITDILVMFFTLYKLNDCGVELIRNMRTKP